MERHEVLSLIRQELRVALQIIASGQTANSTQTTEDIAELFPGMPTVTSRPIMRPWGLVSRAPKGTISVTGQQGNHPGNKLTLGHRDANPPAVEVGETAIYNVAGYIVKLSGTSVQIIKSGTTKTMVVGEDLKELLGMLLDAIVAHTHTSAAPGSPTGPPLNASAFTQLKTNYVENDKILAKDGGAF